MGGPGRQAGPETILAVSPTPTGSGSDGGGASVLPREIRTPEITGKDLGLTGGCGEPFPANAVRPLHRPA